MTVIKRKGCDHGATYQESDHQNNVHSCVPFLWSGAISNETIDSQVHFNVLTSVKNHERIGIYCGVEEKEELEDSWSDEHQ